jgi:hypothetical protein
VVKIKQCTICKEEKELSEFYTQKKYSKKRGEYLYYSPYCKECTKKKSYQWQINNPERRKELLRKYNRSKKGRKHFREYAREYRKSGKYKEWQQNNKDKLKQYNKQHRIHEITEREWQKCKEYFDYSCAYCGMTEEEHKKKYGQQLHKEHVDHEGANDLSNCVPACKLCNSSKQTSDFIEWYHPDYNPNYTKDRYNKIIRWLEQDYKKFIERK